MFRFGNDRCGSDRRVALRKQQIRNQITKRRIFISRIWLARLHRRKAAFYSSYSSYNVHARCPCRASWKNRTSPYVIRDAGMRKGVRERKRGERATRGERSGSDAACAVRNYIWHVLRREKGAGDRVSCPAETTPTFTILLMYFEPYAHPPRGNINNLSISPHADKSRDRRAAFSAQKWCCVVSNTKYDDQGKDREI